MSQVVSTIKNIFSGSFSKEKRVTFMGTRGSGKTTTLGCLYLTCQILSAMEPGFKYQIVEKTSGIREAPSQLRRGRFPTATKPGAVYEADIVMRWEQWGNKTIRLPFCETAGEDVQKLLARFEGGMYDVSTSYQQVDAINKYILDSNGFVLVAPVNRALIFQGQGLEPEPEDVSQDPDVNLARILDSIFSYKEVSRSSPIEGIAVLLTKYDLIMPLARSMGMDLSQPQGAKAFLDVYFPDTSGSLKAYGLDKVSFFPVWVQVEKNEKNEIVKWPDDGDKIVMDERRRLPSYSIDTYKHLIKYIKATFAK